MARAAAVRETVELPGAGRWEIDPSHSEVGFSVRHLMVSKVRGRFDVFEGSIEVGETPESSSVEVRIDAASITTADGQRDGHLRSPDFLDVEGYPSLTFRSTGVERTGPSTLRVAGDLTIRDVSAPVVLEAEYHGEGPDPWGGARLGFSASTEIDREQFGITWNQALETGGVVVGKKVRIELEVEAVKR